MERGKIVKVRYGESDGMFSDELFGMICTLSESVSSQLRRQFRDEKRLCVCVCVVCGYPRKSVFSANGLRFELNECVITGIMVLLFELLMLTGLLSLRKCEKKLEKSNGNAIALEKYFKLLCCRFKLLNFTLIISKQYWSMLFVLAIS